MERDEILNWLRTPTGVSDTTGEPFWLVYTRSSPCPEILGLLETVTQTPVVSEWRSVLGDEQVAHWDQFSTDTLISVLTAEV